jgi:hypothetical protein
LSGVCFDNHAATNNRRMSKAYTYRPLQTPRSIRILRLDPGQYDDPLRGAIYHVVLEAEHQGRQERYVEIEPPPPAWGRNGQTEIFNAFIITSYEDHVRRYEALSYVWGTAVYTHEITTREGVVRITPSLAQALRMMRRKLHYRNIWADAICINQKDLIERGQQVLRMGNIYSKAEGVLVWLGQPPAQNSDRIYGHYTWSWYLREAERRGKPDTEAAEVVHQFEWFSRLWVVQEIFLAREALFICGDEKGSEEASRSAVLLDYRKLSLRDSRIVGHWYFSKAYSMRFLDILEVTNTLRCADDHDRIYGIMGLQYDSFYPLSTAIREIEPDYSKPVSQLYMEIACICVQNFELPRILSQADRRCMSTLGLPSWVPDWSCPSRAMLEYEQFISPDWNFLPNLRQGRRTCPEVSIDRLSGTLIISGNSLSRVIALIPTRQDADATLRTWSSVRTSTIEGKEASHLRRSYFMSELRSLSELLRTEFGMSHARRLEWLAHSLIDAGVSVDSAENDPAERSLFNSQDIMTMLVILERENDESRHRPRDSYSAIHHFRLFQAEDTALYLGPSRAQIGDILVQFPGSELYPNKTLVILREQDDHFVFVGNAIDIGKDLRGTWCHGQPREFRVK